MGVILVSVFPTEEHFFLIILPVHSKVCIPRDIHFQRHNFERASAIVMCLPAVKVYLSIWTCSGGQHTDPQLMDYPKMD